MEENRDREIRQKLKQKDGDFQQELKETLNSEEQELKQYFKEFKKPVKQDPTKIKRSETMEAIGEQRAQILKQALKPFTLFYTFYEFWNIQCATVEENRALRACKENMIKNMTIGVGGSLIITSLTSLRFKSRLPMSLHLLGLGTALVGGFLYGAITSTQYTLERFQKLGTSYELGRIARSEIEKYRMDQITPS